ncbi:MAG: hypothetical protein KF809_05470 [Chloroflexi bacterium]|nr:hypothetical protein [Chloroflexota bacterium]
MLDTLDQARLSGPQTSPAPTSAVSSLYVVGGRQRSLRPIRAHFGDWYEYEAAVMLRVDPRTGSAEQVLEYVTPADQCPAEDPAILYKSGTRVDDRLYLTTQTEVMVHRLPDLALEHRISLPSFNDVHHVRPTGSGTLLVAITGLDMVTEVTLGGEVVQEWNVYQPGEPVWGDRFQQGTDYRLIATTKPHLAHPNHVFHIGDEPWATRFQQRDAISLWDPTRRIDIGLERIHDGIVYGDQVMFTTVDGKVAIADTRSLEVTEIIDLRDMHPADLLLGWCRGLLLDGDRLWVGFSRMRATRFRDNVAWVKNRFRHYLGTHVACYDLRERRCLAQIDTEAAGLNAVFGIYSAD